MFHFVSNIYVYANTYNRRKAIKLSRQSLLIIPRVKSERVIKLECFIENDVE